MTARGIRPKHSFGQNFLVDDQKLSGISKAALSLFDKSCDTPKKRTVIEFGPGLGALTGAEKSPTFYGRLGKGPLKAQPTPIQGR